MMAIGETGEVKVAAIAETYVEVAVPSERTRNLDKGHEKGKAMAETVVDVASNLRI